MIKALPALATGGWKEKGSPAALALYILAASAPGMIGGLVIHEFQPAWEESLHVIAWTSIIFGALLWVADKYRPALLTVADMNAKNALLIGLAQALALIPGVSRSGVTMSAARALGYNRIDSVRFSFFMAIVIIAGAGLVGAHDLIKLHNPEIYRAALIIAAGSFVSGWAAIAFLLRWLQTRTFTPFVVYRVGLGFLLLGLFYEGVLR
jgi:undecaprenyl-diphosphatase